MRASRAHRVVARLTLAWFGVVGTGITLVTRYKGTPGVQAAAPERWPTDSAVRRATDRSTLILLAHPRCPCTRASIGELSELRERVGDRLRIVVLFIAPQGVEAGWTDTDLWRSAAAIPGVEVIRDARGAEARRFGAETSGQAIVYDASGLLIYRGGLTPARGHAGSEVGRDRLAALVLGREPASLPVFGCKLLDPKPAQAGTVGL
jgi:hypothetical protein